MSAATLKGFQQPVAHPTERPLWAFSSYGMESCRGETFRFTDFVIEVTKSKQTAEPPELDIEMIRAPLGSIAALRDDFSFVADKVGCFEFLFLWRDIVIPKRVVAFCSEILSRADFKIRPPGTPPNRGRLMLRGCANDVRFATRDIELSMELLNEPLPRSPATNERGEISCNPRIYCS